MSIICAAIKNGEIAIACDTQINFGSLCASHKRIKNCIKYHEVNGSYMGLVGWNAIADIVNHLTQTQRELFNLDSRMAVFETLTRLHAVMKDKYFIEVKEDDENQPVESSQLDAIIINKHGLFEISSYREVNEYNDFWAIGSGRRYALGAMQVLHSMDITATEIVERAAIAAAEFDESCGLPVFSKMIKLAI